MTWDVLATQEDAPEIVKRALKAASDAEMILSQLPREQTPSGKLLSRLERAENSKGLN